MSGTFEVELAKEDFKFSSAHFTVFSPKEAELLHGHNYRVSVRLRGDAVDELGFLLPFRGIKARIRELCAALDEHVLIPSECPHLEIGSNGTQTVIRFSDREYRLPQEDVLLLPLVNITVEVLARHVFCELRGTLSGSSVTHLRVNVAETDGQGASWEDSI